MPPSTTRVKLDVKVKMRERFRQDALAAWDRYQSNSLHASAEDADAWLAKLQAGKKIAPPKCRARSGRGLRSMPDASAC